MMLPLVVFLFVVFVIVGGYAAVTYLPGMIENRKLDRRLKEVTFTPTEPTAVEAGVVKRASAGPLPMLDKLMSGSGAVGPLARLIEQSGVETTPGTIIIASVLLTPLLGFATSMFVRTPFLPLGAAMVGAFAPFGFLMHRRGSRLKKFEEQFPEALDLLSRAVRAGHAFQTSMGMAADELPPPVGPEFKKAFDRQNFGLPLREALNEMADRTKLMDVKFFVTAVLIQRDTGGNLAEILDNLSHVVRERFKIQRQVRVHTAHGRFTGYVLLALPAALGVALSFINPDHMNLLFHEHMGQMMLIGAIVMQTVGFFWIRHVIKIEV